MNAYIQKMKPYNRKPYYLDPYYWLLAAIIAVLAVLVGLAQECL